MGDEIRCDSCDKLLTNDEARYYAGLCAACSMQEFIDGLENTDEDSTDKSRE